MTYYTIIEASDGDKLVDHVESFLAEGWEPQGGVAVVSLNPELPRTSMLFFQALVKRTKRSTKRRRRGKARTS